MRSLISLLQLGLMFVLVSGDYCPYKECYCSVTDIMCNYRYMQAMPQKLLNDNPLMKSLNLDGNDITTIPAGSLPANLSGLSLEENPTQIIDDTAFDESIYTLQTITFGEARFTHIPKAVFHLKALKTLQIYETNILTWNEDAMNRLGATIEKLSLLNVGLTSWPIWMKSMTNLTDLIISGCPISFIPDDALQLMAGTLTYLDLSNTSLTTLPKSLSNMTLLNSLSINHNNIIDVTWFPQSSNLQNLYINSNKITDALKLSSVLRSYANTLNNFDIQDNSLTSFPELSFLTLITTLDVAFNHLTDANSGSLPYVLTELNLDNNMLNSFPTFMKNLQKLSQLFISSNNIQTLYGSNIPPSVEALDLSFNSLSQLTRSSFPKGSSLNYLYLNNNPLSTISSDAFSNLVVLNELKLQNTKLTRLPIAISSLTTLTYLDVSGCSSLVCTCLEKSLEPWIKSLGPYGVMGDCGATSVYVFFEELSPECPGIL